MGLDFMAVNTRLGKSKITEVYPGFMVGRSKDLMIRGGDVYAVWDDEKKVWCEGENDIIPLLDREIKNVYDEVAKYNPTAVPLYD